MDINLKALIGRLNRSTNRALETAAGTCVSRGHYEVTVEHWLAALIEDPHGDLQHILKHFEIEVTRVQKALTATLERARTGNSSRPVFSQLLIELIQAAWLVASLDCGHADIRSGVLFLALLGNRARFCAGDYDQLFEPANRQELLKKLDIIVAGSAEQTAFAASASAAPGGGAGGPQGDSALARFCTNFTQRARDGKIDPVFGRDVEIRQMVDILARRRKNNPICVGEPGVGKTAVVEGLALRIVEDDVPDSLRGVDVLGLDLGLLQAGASVKGEFENRLKGVLDEIKQSPKPIILFIDEAHMLIGAGGSAGMGDAANMLKPALARGEMKTIAATTWSEYKKYFEKDAALARRFQLVKLDEPSNATTVTMLRGLRASYEKAHNVIITDEALVAAAELGTRYISGRQQPDKGIDLIDTAAARVKVALSAKPAALQDVERRIQDIERALTALKRDRDIGGAEATEDLAGLAAELASCKQRQTTLTANWHKEKTAADAVIAARLSLMAATSGTPEAETLRADVQRAYAALRTLQGDEPLIHIEVTPEVVSKVIADWTGIPVGNMMRNQAESLLSFEKKLRERIKGQDHVMEIVGTGIRAAKAGLKDPRTPMGVFLFVGPSGVGKTETATGIADLLFGGERFMTAINMSEFQEKHTVSRLVGSPPGYVGYGEGGVLTEAVRQRPYSVVLLDEVEKADLDVMNLFYQVFDKGSLSDGEGREIDFKNTVIFLTSNLATDLIAEACADGAKPDLKELTERIRPALSRHFKPALLARMTIVPFYPIGSDALREIARLKLGRLRERLSTTHRMALEIDDSVIAAIAARCTEVETGARNVDHIITGTLLPRISTEILTRLGEGALPERLTIGTDASGFTFAFSALPRKATKTSESAG